MVVLLRRALSVSGTFLILYVASQLCGTRIPLTAAANIYLYEVFLGGRYGFADTNGTVVIKPQFEQVRAFENGLAAIEEDGRWGYIDVSGRIVIPPAYDTADDFSDGLAVVSKNNRYFYIDATGKVMIAGPFDKAKRFSNGLAPVELNEQWQYIAPSGTVMIAGPFSIAEPFSEAYAAVRRPGENGTEHWSYVDTSGDRVTVQPFDSAGAFSDGAAPVKSLGSSGVQFIDSSGAPSFPGQFTAALSFSDGLAPVERNKRWGYIDATGRMAIPERFVQAGPFVGGRAKVVDGVYGTSYYIDRGGREVFSASDRIEQNLGGFRLVAVSISVTSNPTERVPIFLVPLLVADETPGLTTDLSELRLHYRIRESDTTPVKTNVYEQTYVLVYDDAGKLEQKEINVVGPGANDVGVSLQ